MNKHDYEGMTTKNRDKYDKEVQNFRDAMNKAEADGYRIFCSLKSGSNSSFSFEKNGVKSAYGFDSKEDVLIHLKYL